MLIDASGSELADPIVNTIECLLGIHRRPRVARCQPAHMSLASVGRYITTNLQMKREAMQTFWRHAGIEPSRAKPWSPTPDLLALSQSLRPGWPYAESNRH